MDGETKAERDLPGTGSDMDVVEPVAGTGDGRNASGSAAVALNPRLAVLLERKSKGGSIKGLERRLARLQGSSVPKPGELQEIATEKKL